MRDGAEDPESWGVEERRDRRKQERVAGAGGLPMQRWVWCWLTDGWQDSTSTDEQLGGSF